MYRFKEYDNSESIFYYNDIFLSEEEQKELFNELENYEMEVYPNSTRQMLWLDELNRPYNFSRVKLESKSLLTPTTLAAECNTDLQSKSLLTPTKVEVNTIKSNVQKLINKINNFINTHFNKIIGIEKKVNYKSILVNKYCGKYSGVGWHSDNEPCIPENSIIVSISIGDEREFEIKRMTESERETEYKKLNKKFIKNENEKYEMHRFKLKSGSIFIMAGSAQNYAANIKSMTIKNQDMLLISKYRTDYENAILNLDDLIGTMMAKTALSVDQSNPMASLEKLVQLNNARGALNSVMKFVDTTT
jgi:hypothetical protein